MKIALKSSVVLLVLFILSCGAPKYLFDQDEIFSEIKESVYTLAADDMMGRETGTEGEIKASQYIMSEFVQIGVQAFPSLGGYLQPFVFTANPHFDPEHGHPIGKSIGHNVVGYLENGKDDWIVVGAHYDHIGMGGPYSREPDMHAIHNGADDNASGVAAVLALARQLRSKNLKYNVLLIAFSGEEFGLWGSKHFIDNLPIASSSIKYMLNFDMVGRMSDAKELVIQGTGTSPYWPEALNESNETIGLKLVMKESGNGPSDHAAFYRKDIPVLFFFTGQNEDYHKPSDDADKINYPGLHAISELARNLVFETQKYKKMDFQKTKDQPTKRMDFKVTLGVTPDYVYQGAGMRIDAVKADRPAHKAGLEKGDIVVRIGDHDIADLYKYMEVLSKFSEGDKTKITVLRNEQKRTFDLTW